MLAAFSKTRWRVNPGLGLCICQLVIFKLIGLMNADELMNAVKYRLI